MCSEVRQNQVSYWLNQVESLTRLESSGLTLARRVTQDTSYKTRVRLDPKQAEHKQLTDGHPHTNLNY